MLNLKNLLDPVMASNVGGESGILSSAVRSIQKLITSDEKFDIKTKMMIIKNSGPIDDQDESVEIDVEKSLDKSLGTVKNIQQTTTPCINGSNDELRIISLDEIAWHDTPDDCWFAIYDYVYDCTSFIRDHPGGDDVLLEYAGRDATLAFIGAGHTKFAQKTLERYLIGELPHNERIFRIDGGVKVLGF